MSRVEKPRPRSHRQSGPRRRIIPRLEERQKSALGYLAVGLLMLSCVVLQAFDQIKIDAHRVEVTGTIVEIDEGKHQDDYIATYSYQGRKVRSEAFGIPWTASEYDELCLEIDSTKPERARACGQRMDTLTFLGILMSTVFLLVAAVSRVRSLPDDSGPLGRWLVRRRRSAGVRDGG